MWDHVKDQDRFKPFLSRILHIIIDDSDLVTDGSAISSIAYYLESTDDSEKVKFAMENIENAAGFKAFLKWNSQTKFMKEGDVFVNVRTSSMSFQKSYPQAIITVMIIKK